MLELTIVDAFTEVPFTGNPAAVVVIDTFPDDGLMQAVAREMNLSETAFVVPRPEGDYDLRWFTPIVEVELCGHATLAAAHVLGGEARFHTASAVLTCVRADQGLIEMDFPADPPAQATPPPELELPEMVWYGQGRYDALVQLQGPASVQELKPDLAAIAALGTRSLIITARAESTGVDFVSRVFAPNAGVPEDPVTGSAHCTLAEFWGDRLGRRRLVGKQVSARGGIVHMRRIGDRVSDRVVLGGRAVTVARVTMDV